MTWKFNPFTATLGEVPIATSSGTLVETQTSYTIDESDDAVLCNTLANTIVVTLPSASENKRVYIKKTNQNNIVSVVGGVIENDSELRLMNLGTAVTLVCDGVKWWVV